LQNKGYDLRYAILSDYAKNIEMYLQKIPYKIIEIPIAKCLSSGVSKTGKWSIYQEEIFIKTRASSIILYPFFYIMVGCKFFLRKIQNTRKL
jgi:hypothetical protein